MYSRPFMKLHSSILLLSLVFAFTGYATAPKNNLDDIGKYVSLRQGSSTKQDVHRAFGQPADVTFQITPPAISRWTYFHVRSRASGWSFVPYVGILAGGTRNESTTATFHFDAADRYINVETSKDSSYANNWATLARGISRINTETKASRVEQEMRRLQLPFDKKAAEQQEARR